MADDISAKDLLEKLDKYHNEIVALAEKTTENVHTLKRATELVDEHRKHRGLKILAVIALIIVGLMITMRATDVCKVSFNPEGNSGFIEKCK